MIKHHFLHCNKYKCDGIGLKNRGVVGTLSKQHHPVINKGAERITSCQATPLVHYINKKRLICQSLKNGNEYRSYCSTIGSTGGWVGVPVNGRVMTGVLVASSFCFLCLAA